MNRNQRTSCLFPSFLAFFVACSFLFSLNSVAASKSANDPENGPNETGTYSHLFCANTDGSLTIEASGPTVLRKSTLADAFIIQYLNQDYKWDIYNNEFNIQNPDFKQPYLMNHNLTFKKYIVPAHNSENGNLVLDTNGQLQLLTKTFYLRLLHRESSQKVGAKPYVIIQSLETNATEVVELNCLAQRRNAKD